MPESCVEIRHAILAKFHKPFFSNFSVVAKGLGFEAFAAGSFLVGRSARVLRRNSTRDPCKVSEAIFSNFSVVAKGLGFEACTAGRFSCSARVLRRNSTRDPCKVS